MTAGHNDMTEDALREERTELFRLEEIDWVTRGGVVATVARGERCAAYVPEARLVVLRQRAIGRGELVRPWPVTSTS